MTQAKAILIPSDMARLPADVALEWAHMGFPVFPCGPDKSPLTAHGFKDATADPARVAAMWRAHPSALVGLPTGDVSGLFVVDLDTDKETGEVDGERTLAALGLPDLWRNVPTVCTPSGGRHLYFQNPGLGSTVKRLGRGIDTRGNGGYVIAAGSIGPAGAYIAQGARVSKETLPALPAPLLDALRGNPRPERLSFQIDTGAWGGTSVTSRAEVEEILSYIPASCGYDDWLTVLMGLHDRYQGTPEGMTLADQWSATGGTKYHPGEVAAKWNGFTLGGGRAWESVCALARANGADLSDIARRHKGRGMPLTGKVTSFAQPANAGAFSPECDDTGEYFTAADLAGKPVPPREWHVADMIPGNTVTMLGGDGGTGKSLLVAQLAVSTALGRSWLGQETKSGSVLFVSAEDDRDELHRRLADICRAETASLDAMPNLVLRSLAGKDAVFAAATGPGKTLAETPLFSRVAGWIAEHRPKLVVFDTLADLFGGEENNRTHARQFISLLRGLCQQYRTTVVLLYHPSLSGMNSGSGMSGSTGWNNSVRSRLYLRRVVSEDGDKGIEQDPDTRELEVMKANYGRKGANLPLRWKEGVFILDAPPALSGLNRMAASAKAERVFLKLLRLFTQQGRRVNHKGSKTYAPTAFANHPEAEGCTKRVLALAMDTLLGSGQIAIASEGPRSRPTQFLYVVGG